MKDQGNPKVIWLEPSCVMDCADATDRMWCQDDVWGECEDCGTPPQKYIRADIAEAYRIDALEEATKKLRAYVVDAEATMLRSEQSQHSVGIWVGAKQAFVIIRALKDKEPTS